MPELIFGFTLALPMSGFTWNSSMLRRGLKSISSASELPRGKVGRCAVLWFDDPFIFFYPMLKVTPYGLSLALAMAFYCLSTESVIRIGFISRFFQAAGFCAVICFICGSGGMIGKLAL